MGSVLMESCATQSNQKTQFSQYLSELNTLVVVKVIGWGVGEGVGEGHKLQESYSFSKQGYRPPKLVHVTVVDS